MTIKYIFLHIEFSIIATVPELAVPYLNLPLATTRCEAENQTSESQKRVAYCSALRGHQKNPSKLDNMS